MSIKHGFLYVLLIAVLVAGIIGCERVNDIVEPTLDDPVDDLYAEPVTPEILMENFARAYTSRDLDRYAEMLNEDFIFSLQPCDVQRLGLSKDHYDRDDELATAGRMFSGRPVVKDDGRTLPAITDIKFQVWEQVGEWIPDVDAVGADVQRCTYQCKVCIVREGDTNLQIRGQNVFYAKACTFVDCDDVTRLRYELVGWVDLTEGCN